MALINCPECGKEVSTAAEICPHCGYPLKKELEQKEIEELKPYKKPLDESWMNDWKKIPGRRKITLTIAYFVNLLIVAIFILIGMMNQNDGIFPVWSIIGAGVSGFFTILTFSFWIAGFICVKYKAIECNGYHAIAVASVFHNYLVIEGKICEKAFNRHLDGNLPNGKHVIADFAAWDSSIRMSIQDESYRTIKK